MSWDTAAGDSTWKQESAGDTWGASADTGVAIGANDSWGVEGNGNSGDDTGGGDNQTCRICKHAGHFARDCPDKPEGNFTGECYNCGQVGHNKAQCPNERVERPFTGNCNSCGQEGHAARNCPSNPIKCKLCHGEGHMAIDCKSRRIVDWTGIPEMDPTDAWKALIDAAGEKDLDAFRTSLGAYARATMDEFSLPSVENVLREEKLGVYLIAKQQEIATNMTIVDLIGNPDREYVLSIQLSEKPRRAKQAQGWPENPQQNIDRLTSAGFVQDRGVPLCNNCGELGHIRKHCKQEQAERLAVQPIIQCVYCQEEGHRARDCPKERVNPFACKNCKQEGHNAKDCPEPRSAEGVECRKCNETGHFSKDCPNVEARGPRTCRNCGSEDHIAKECDQPRNPDTVTCRNCEKQGHFSRDCPEPKDWSKVKCSNCGEMGHTIKRCKAPIAKGDTIGDGGPVEASGGWDAVQGGDSVEASGNWNNPEASAASAAGGW